MRKYPQNLQQNQNISSVQSGQILDIKMPAEIDRELLEYTIIENSENKPNANQVYLLFDHYIIITSQMILHEVVQLKTVKQTPN